MARARVQSVDALKEAKAALAEFAESVSLTLTSVDSDINRITQWLNQDRPAHWKREVRKREEMVAKATADIMRKRIIAAPEPASVVEEQKALQKAKHRLASAQRKAEAVRRWAPNWEREALLYKTACRGLSESVHHEIPKATTRLERMMVSLEEYLRLAVPQTDSPAGELPPSEPGDASADAAADEGANTGNP